MKTFSNCMMVLFALLVFFSPCLNAVEEIHHKVSLPFEDSITFYASFDYGDLLADLSVGERGKSSDSKARYMVGIHGKAVVLGQDSINTFVLSCKDHMSFKKQGTLIFWMQPQGWAHSKKLEKSPTYNHLVASPYSPKGHLGIQRMAYKNGNERIIFYMDGYNGGSMQIHQVDTWKDGEWHMLALVWNLREFSFYVDGVIVKSQLLGKSVANEEEPSVLIFEPRMPTALDEIIVYGIQLSAKDIASIHKAYLSGKTVIKQ